MELSSIGPNYGASAGAAGSAAASQGTGQETFLRLLVTQLSNQDPLNPTDPTEFVSQLAEFSGLEQLVGVNPGMEMLLVSQSAATSAQVVGMVGKSITFSGDTFAWTPGQEAAELGFTLPETSVSTQVVIRDASGEVVRTIDGGAMAAGKQVVAFDGRDDDLNDLGAGTYSFSVVAKDAQGNQIEAETSSEGLVVGVTFEGGYPQLVVEGGQKVLLGQVLEVTDPEPGATRDREVEPAAAPNSIGPSDPTSPTGAS